MQPEFEDETPINPFDFWQGANFKLKIVKKDGYWNYDKSEFSKSSPLLDDDEELEKLRTCYADKSCWPRVRIKAACSVPSANTTTGTPEETSAELGENAGQNLLRLRAEIKEVLTFIFGDENTEAIITDSRQITTLANVVANPDGLKALRAGKSLDEAKQKIASSGQTPLERLVNRLTAGKNALVAAADDIADSHGEEVVKTLLTEIEDALGTLKTAAEEDA
jgi:hypothetical protein